MVLSAILPRCLPEHSFEYSHWIHVHVFTLGPLLHISPWVFLSQNKTGVNHLGFFQYFMHHYQYFQYPLTHSAESLS